MDEALYEFIAAFTSVRRENIIKGWGKTAMLPPDAETYAVFTVLSAERRGTNLERYKPDEVALIKSSRISVQIDIVSPDAGEARRNACALETVAGSAAGVNFFNKFGVALLYADDVKAIETVSKTDNYVNRYMLTVYLEETNEVNVRERFFDKAAVNVRLT